MYDFRAFCSSVKKVMEINVQWGTLIDQAELIGVLDNAKDDYQMQGADW